MQLSNEEQKRLLAEAESIRTGLASLSGDSPEIKKQRIKLTNRYYEIDRMLGFSRAEKELKFDSDTSSSGPPPIPPHQATTKCPCCREAILKGAKKCKHCGEWLDINAKQDDAKIQAAAQAKAKQELDAKNFAVGCLIFIAIVFVVVVWNSLPSERAKEFDSPTMPYTPALQTQKPTPTVEAPVEVPIDDSLADTRIRELARSEYPNDSRMQQYIYQQQLSAYRYMKTVSDSDVKGIATREYPTDYSMQKYVYDQQLSAKRYMSTIDDVEVKQSAVQEYPSDYSMQKYAYDQQLTAKQYMNSQPNSAAKNRAQSEYPHDYTMQKYIYDRSQF